MYAEEAAAFQDNQFGFWSKVSNRNRTKPELKRFDSISFGQSVVKSYALSLFVCEWTKKCDFFASSEDSLAMEFRLNIRMTAESTHS